MSRTNNKPNKAVINRLSRIVGQIEGIKRMCEEGRSCSEILIQISAVKSAVNNTAKIVLADHVDHCIEEFIETNDKDVLESLNDALGNYIS